MAVPQGCSFQSAASVTCQSSAQPRLEVAFSNITLLPGGVTRLKTRNEDDGRKDKVQKREENREFKGRLEQSQDDDGHGVTAVAAAAAVAVVSNLAVPRGVGGSPPGAESVVVNGETCVVDSSCPILGPIGNGTTTTLLGTSPTGTRPTASTSSSSSSSSSSSPSSSLSSGKKGMIIGISVAVILVVLVALCFFWRRHRKNAATSTQNGQGRGMDGMMNSTTELKAYKGSECSLSLKAHHHSTTVTKTTVGVAAVSGSYPPPLHRKMSLKREWSGRESGQENAVTMAATDISGPLNIAVVPVAPMRMKEGHAVSRGMERMRSEERLRSMDSGSRIKRDRSQDSAAAAAVKSELGGRRPSVRTTRSTTLVKSHGMLDSHAVEILSATLSGEGLNMDEYLRSSGERVRRSEDAKHYQQQQQQQQQQHSVIRKAKSSGLLQVSGTGSSLNVLMASAPISGDDGHRQYQHQYQHQRQPSRQGSLNRAASAGTMRGSSSGDSNSNQNGRVNHYHTDSIIDPHQPTLPFSQQQQQSHHRHHHHQQQQQQSQREYLTLRSEPILVSNCEPQMPSVAPTRSMPRRGQPGEVQAYRDWGQDDQHAVRPTDKVGSHGLYGYL
ncbi:hypothetical protein EDD11_005742 [Mortierella claussenii]|nr:hypothetical protein EDD11_005742 [Mortierella claussenii]